MPMRQALRLYGLRQSTTTGREALLDADASGTAPLRLALDADASGTAPRGVERPAA